MTTPSTPPTNTSETPRCDEEARLHNNEPRGGMGMANWRDVGRAYDFARQLERELAISKTELAERDRMAEFNEKAYEELKGQLADAEKETEKLREEYNAEIRSCSKHSLRADNAEKVAMGLKRVLDCCDATNYSAWWFQQKRDVLSSFPADMAKRWVSREVLENCEKAFSELEDAVSEDGASALQYFKHIIPPARAAAQSELAKGGG